jgi:ribosomal protein RSM22 (predicted rRNA methylase)
MELPTFLRRGIDRMLEGVPLTDLRHSAELLSRRYRAEIRDGKLHLADEQAGGSGLQARTRARLGRHIPVRSLIAGT